MRVPAAETIRTVVETIIDGYWALDSGCGDGRAMQTPLAKRRSGHRRMAQAAAYGDLHRSPNTSAKQTRWSALVEYADHQFSFAVTCAQLGPRACDADDGRSAGHRRRGSGRAAWGREGGCELLAGADREFLVGVGEVSFDGPGGDE